MSAGRLARAGAALVVALAPLLATAAAPSAGAGASIYLRGALPSGGPLQGTRASGAIAGEDAACVSCHQRSGLGTVEGNLTVPPITGDHLFRSRAQEFGAPVPWVESGHGDRPPYTDATLARAIREGVDSQGRPLDDLMPRFALGDADMAALIAYLRGLAEDRVPGVGDGVLQFATVVTPDADPVKRRGMLDVLERYFLDRNRLPLKPSPPMRTSGRTQYTKSMYMANRRWALHVWELSGPASSWRAQLERRLAAEPIYALISGLGGSDWAPVHEFCERDRVPCLFPNVEVPADADGDFWSVYFSRGVLLEAALVADRLLDGQGGPAPREIEQVYRAGDSGARAAAALAAEVEGHGVRVHRTVLPARARGRTVTAALRAATRRAERPGRTLVLWLRPDDVAALARVPPGSAPVFLSGILGGLEQAPLPAAWRAHTRMTYPFDLPAARRVRLDYPLGWFAIRRIPLVSEQVQTDTYLACSLLADVLNRMADNFSRPYLVEQLQDQVEHRLITGYYPHLTLATHQHFASKGGYLVRFRDPAGTALVAEGDWTVP